MDPALSKKWPVGSTKRVHKNRGSVNADGRAQNRPLIPFCSCSHIALSLFSTESRLTQRGSIHPWDAFGWPACRCDCCSNTTVRRQQCTRDLHQVIGELVVDGSGVEFSPCL